MLLQIVDTEVLKLIATGEQIGYQRCLEDNFISAEDISINQAKTRWGQTTVSNWIKYGKIKYRTEGNGKTSTKKLKIKDCIKLAASEIIVIHKPYISKSTNEI